MYLKEGQQGLQTAACGPNPAREAISLGSKDICQWWKNNKITKRLWFAELLSWQKHIT